MIAFNLKLIVDNRNVIKFVQVVIKTDIESCNQNPIYKTSSGM